MKIFEKTCRCVFITLFIFGCGYKVVNYSEINNFDIASIETSGNKRINYKIKNKLLFNSSKNDKRLIKINLETIKDKKIKERNIRNEITKYQISIKVKISYSEINSLKKDQFEIIKSGSYNVAKQHSNTLDNEKKIVELLIENISDQILDQLRLKLNAI